MSPGQGLYLQAVVIATPTMTNTRTDLCQVGEAQRDRTLCFHHSEELLIFLAEPGRGFRLGAAQLGVGCAVGEVRVMLGPLGL